MEFGTKLTVNLPNDTKIAALQIYNAQNIYIRLGDNLPKLLNRINLSRFDYSSTLDQNSILRLTLICIFQFMESMPDTIASNATLKRLDWRYALLMPMNHPGIPSKAICNFRQGLLSSSEGLNEFGNFLEMISEIGLFDDCHSESLNPRDSLKSICQVNQFYFLQKTMKTGLGLVSSLAPDWFITQVPPHWYTRYLSSSVPLHSPSTLVNFHALADQVGRDMFLLLSSLEELNFPELVSNPDIQILNKIFQEQFLLVDEKVQLKTGVFSNCTCQSYAIEGGE